MRKCRQEGTKKRSLSASLSVQHWEEDNRSVNRFGVVFASQISTPTVVPIDLTTDSKKKTYTRYHLQKKPAVRPLRALQTDYNRKLGINMIIKAQFQALLLAPALALA